MLSRYIFFHLTLLDYLFIYVLHAFVLLLLIFGIHLLISKKSYFL